MPIICKEVITLYNNVNPTPSEVRAWGYDKNALFLEQDEDLILHDVAYAPILVELAADNACPKQEYAASILSYFSQLTLLHRNRSDADVLAALAGSANVEEAPLVQRWREWYLWLYDRLIHPRTFATDESDRAAWLLGVGDYCYRDFTATGRKINGYTEYLASTSSFRLYIYVGGISGSWQTSGYKPQIPCP